MFDQRGIALITAMLIAALVTAGAVALASSQQLNTRRIANILTVSRARYTLETMELQARDSLRKDAEHGRFDATSEAWATEKLSASQIGVSSEGELVDLSGRFNLTNLVPDPEFAGGSAAEVPREANANPAAPSTEAGAPTTPTASSTDANAPATPAVPCTDPNGCAAPTTAQTPGAQNAGVTLPPAEIAAQQLRRLFEILQLDTQPIQAIQDWVDADTDTRFPNGAEDDYYTSLHPAYRAANRPFASPRELLLVKGVTVEMYQKLAPFIVCLPKTTPLNVNTASKELLMSLGPTVDASAAETLLRTRETQPFTDIGLFQNHPMMLARPLLQTNITVSSEYFEMRGHSHDDRLELQTRTLLARQGPTTRVLGRWPMTVETP